MLRTLRRIRPADLEPSLLLLPFPAAQELLRLLHHLLERGIAVELCARCVLPAWSK